MAEISSVTSHSEVFDVTERELNDVQAEKKPNSEPPAENITRTLARIQLVYEELMNDLSQYEKDKMKEKKEKALGTCVEAGHMDAKQGTVALIQGVAGLGLRLISMGMESEVDQKLFEFLGGQFTEHVGGWVKSGYQSNATNLQGRLRIVTAELDQISQSNMYTKGSKDKFAQLMQELYQTNRQAYRG